MVDAGAIPLVVAALQVNAQDPYVQRNGCIALGRLAAGVELGAEAGKQVAIEAGAIPLLLSAMRRLHADAKMQTNGCWVLSRPTLTLTLSLTLSLTLTLSLSLTLSLTRPPIRARTRSTLPRRGRPLQPDPHPSHTADSTPNPKNSPQP